MTSPSEERVMRAREVLAAEYEATAPAGKYVARDIRNGILSAENERAIRAMLAFSDAGSGIGKLREAARDRWKPIELAPKDGTYILAIVAPNESRHLEHQTSRMFVIRHEGKTENGYDLGWSVYPGYGGASDHNFTHFRPLPSPPDIDRSGLAQEVE